MKLILPPTKKVKIISYVIQDQCIFLIYILNFILHYTQNHPCCVFLLLQKTLISHFPFRVILFIIIIQPWIRTTMYYSLHFKELIHIKFALHGHVVFIKMDLWQVHNPIWFHTHLPPSFVGLCIFTCL